MTDFSVFSHCDDYDCDYTPLQWPHVIIRSFLALPPSKRLLAAVCSAREGELLPLLLLLLLSVKVGKRAAAWFV